MANKPKPSVKIQFLPLRIDTKNGICTERLKFVVSYDKKRIVFSEKSAPFAYPARPASAYINANGETTSELQTDAEQQTASYCASHRLQLLVALELAVKLNEWATMTKPGFDFFIESHKPEIVTERILREYGEIEGKKWIRKLKGQGLL